MANIVLVHGGWHGGWCWRMVADCLRAGGHHVETPTLTGLGERSHLSCTVEGPDTHVQDIVNVIRWNELEDVILVGHSYAGMVITGVATEVPRHIRGLVYVDAYVPVSDNQPAAVMTPEWRIKEMLAALANLGEGDDIPPNGFEEWSAFPEKIEWLKRLTTPQTRACLEKGVSKIVDPSTLDLQRDYIWCTVQDPSPFRHFYDQYSDDGRWTCHTMATLHDPMVDAPEDLARIIGGIAQR